MESEFEKEQEINNTEEVPCEITPEGEYAPAVSIIYALSQGPSSFAVGVNK